MSIRKIATIIGMLIATSSNIVESQSLLDRTPNVSGDWVGAPGTLYFHFVHRFTTSDAPERKVSNVPTFLLAAGLPKHFLAGFNYSTNSTLAPSFPNEWEAFARWMPLNQELGAPLDLGAQVGFNNASDGVDGELSAARRFGAARLLVAGRALSDPFEEGNARFAVAGGATIRLGQYFAIVGDVASLLDRDSTERVAWSGGIHFAIPLTPHTVSIHATNAMLTTLQGASRGAREVRYGFEFTIPLTLRRYFGRREQVADTAVTSVVAPPASPPVVATVEPTVDSSRAIAVAPPAVTSLIPAPAPSSPPPASPVSTEPPRKAPVAKPSTARRTAVQATSQPAAKVVKSGMKNVNYLQQRLQIIVGTTVEWTNNDPMPHTVTAVNGSFNSGLINPGKKYRHTFTKAGTFSFFCQPHPFMKGTIVVREQ